MEILYRSKSLGIIALVPDVWNEIWSSRHMVLRHLASHFPVIWVGPRSNWRAYWLPGGSKFMKGSGITEVSPGLNELEPGLFQPGLYNPIWVSRKIKASVLKQAREALLRKGVKRIALYVWRYAFADALDIVEHDWVVYHIDDEYTFSDIELPVQPAESHLIQRANRVIIHSPRLFEKKGHLNPNTVYIPNGVDFQAYSTPKPEAIDLLDIPHPRIGYSGIIKKQMDFNILLHLANSIPDCSIVLVGPIGRLNGKEAQLKKLQALPNVYFLGGKDAKELPSYVQYFDVCLMCYEINAYTRYIFPLKLHEYLSSGKPVVSSPLDSVLPYRDVLSIAHSPEEWITQVKEALTPGAQSTKEITRRQGRAREFDWRFLVEQIAALFKNESIQND